MNMIDDEEMDEEVDYKAGDITVAEFKQILRLAIEQAMRDALKQANAKTATRKVSKK
jgi:hypothetical protein